MGYFRVPDWLVDSGLREITLPEVRVLLFLLRHANGNGRSFFGIHTMAESLGCSDTQIKVGIRRLETNNCIERKLRKGHSTVYALSEYYKVFK